MQWIGKTVGGIVGFALGGPFGSLLGVFLGHQFDAGAGADFQFGQGGFKAHRIQQSFFATTFEVMGHLAKSDGRVSEDEIRVARQIMHGMRLSPEAVQSAIRYFTEGKQAGYPMQQRLTALRELLGARGDIARAFVEIQVQAAVGAGLIERAKRRSLLEVARLLGIDGAELAQIEAAARGTSTRGGVDGGLTLESAYRVLGVDRTASDRDVKTAYRRLMNQHHPDKLVSRGLPESMIDVAEQKTHEIRAAYERIKSQRSFK
jgi:DnaJ like chaperone protein